METSVFENGADLAAAAADQFISIAHEAIEARGWAKIALSGGSTPEAMYRLLAQPERSGSVNWSRTLLLLGDERFVPYDDPRSNFGMIRKTLLAGIEIPDGNVIPVPTDAASPEKAAQAYESSLRKVLPSGCADLIFLGLGEDGHTASLFPGMPSLSVEDRWVVSSPSGTLPPPVDRVTMTYPILNAARNVIFLVAGEKKADALQRARAADADFHQVPAAGVRPTDGRLIWFVDKAAAGE